MSIRYYDCEEIYLELFKMWGKGLCYLRTGIPRREYDRPNNDTEKPEWVLTNKGKVLALNKGLKGESAEELAAYRRGWFINE